MHCIFLYVFLYIVDVCEKSSPSVTDKKSSSPPLEPQLVKRPRIGKTYTQSTQMFYIAATFTCTNQRGKWPVTG